MSSGNKKKTADGDVTYYDVAAGVSRKGKARKLASKYSSKDTVNLCIRERKGLSAELFFLILAGILIVLLLLEFFGVYRPYLNLETAEKDLAQQQAEVQRIKDEIKDMDEVREEYRKYNYEHFPRERVDRLDVLDLVETVFFDRGIITSFHLSKNTLTLQLTDVLLEDSYLIPAELEASEIVLGYDMPRSEVKYDEATGKVAFGITITFKDAA